LYRQRMHANSSPVRSSQSGIHDQLHALVAKHAGSRFLKPIAPYSGTAFDTSIAAWRAAGERPLILDAGCGTGMSTLNLAMLFPDHFVIGVDQSADRLARKLAWPTTRAMPSNFIMVRADLVDYWRLMHESRMYPDRHYLFYPNPWPKKQHVGRRWHGHPVFPFVIALGGHFECRSNWRIYIDECAAAVTQLTAVEVTTEQYFPEGGAAPKDLSSTPALASSPLTPFESKYLASGHSLWRCRAFIART
jgi:tRNA (guanine-N7-)-methyltransferase